MSKTLILPIIRDLWESAYNTIIQGDASSTSQKIEIAKINRILKININQIATNGGIIHYLKEIIEGIQYQLVDSHTTGKIEKLRRKPYAYRRLRAILE